MNEPTKLDITKPYKIRDSENLKFTLLSTNSGRRVSNGRYTPFIIEAWDKGTPQNRELAYLDDCGQRYSNVKCGYDLINYEPLRPWTNEEFQALPVNNMVFRRNDWDLGSWVVVRSFSPTASTVGIGDLTVTMTNLLANWQWRHVGKPEEAWHRCGVLV